MIEDIAQKRTTVFTFAEGNPHQETVKDEWNDLGPKARRSLEQKWTGKTIFAHKKTINNKLKNERIKCKYPQVVLLEYCAGEKSLLGQATENSKNCEVKRVTEKLDATSDAGHKFSLETVRQSKLPGFLWTSIPCTGGSTWQFINYKREGGSKIKAKHEK